MLIDHTYFKGEIELPGLALRSNEAKLVGLERKLQTVGENKFDDFIAIYEPDFLKKLLGYELYKNFCIGISSDTPLGIWCDLKEQLTHSKSDRISPIAYYVYLFIKANGRSKTTPKGEKKVNASFTDAVDDSFKIQRTSLRLHQMVHEFYRWLKDNWDVYKEYSDGIYSVRCFDFGISNIYGI